MVANRRVTLSHYKRKLAEKAAKLNHPMPVPDYLQPYISDRHYASILDVGSGPFTTVGNQLGSTTIHVVACDILAKGFKRMCDVASIRQYIPVTYQNAESLTYVTNTFDIVHCVNALDHMEHPIKALSEMYRVCKEGGYIYLKHYPNVGERNGYNGFHNWNISDDGRIWNKEESYTLTGYDISLDGRMIVAVRQK